MAKARFCYDNKALGATITASTAVADRPASYLANAARWKKWRSSTTTGDENVVFDFGSAQTVKAMLLVGWKRHGTAGTIKAEYWTGAAWAAFGGGTGLFTLPADNPTGVVALFDTVGVSTAKVRVYFANVGAVSDYAELGVAFAGSYFEPAFNVSDGFAMERVDPSIIVASDGGNESAYQRAQFFACSGRFEYMSAANRASFVTMFSAVGTFKPLFLALDPGNPDEMMYCRFAEKLPAEHVVRSSYNVPISMKESI